MFTEQHKQVHHYNLLQAQLLLPQMEVVVVAVFNNIVFNENRTWTKLSRRVFFIIPITWFYTSTNFSFSFRHEFHEI